MELRRTGKLSIRQRSENRFKESTAKREVGMPERTEALRNPPVLGS